MKASRKYPTVKVRPLGWARRQKDEEQRTGQGEEVLECKEPVHLPSEEVTTPEAEPEAEIVERTTIIETVSLSKDEGKSGEIQEKVSIPPCTDASFPEPVRAAHLKKKRKTKSKQRKVTKPAFPPPAALPTVVFNTSHADITATSEDINTELVRSQSHGQKVAIVPERAPSPALYLTNEQPTDISEDNLIKTPKTSLFRRLFPVNSPLKSVTASILFLRKVYLLLFVEMALTALWTGIVTLCSALQAAMRANYWLVVLWFFILVDVLWVKYRFPAVARRTEAAVLLMALLVGSM